MTDIKLTQNNEKIEVHPMKPFDELITGPFAGPILQVLDDEEFYQPTTFQNQSISILNDGQNNDLIAKASFNSGKTTAFLVSMLLHVAPLIDSPQTIYLVNTPELAMQIFEAFKTFNVYTRFSCDICISNNDDNPTPPNEEAQFLFGIPSSFTYWYRKGQLDLSQVNFLVIDYAITILDKSSPLYPSASYLMKNLPPNVQYAIFSYELKNSIIDDIKKKRPNIFILTIKGINPGVTLWYTIIKNQYERFNVLFDLVTKISKSQTYIFTHSKKISEEIVKFLSNKGVSCKALLNQNELDVINSFARKEFNVLVTYGNVPIGIKMPNVFLSINYQLPTNFSQAEKKSFPDLEKYKYCVERAGCIGKTGISFTILTDDNDEKKLLELCSNDQFHIPLNKIQKTKLDELPKEEFLD